MSKSNIKQGIISGLNAVTSPQAITLQLVNGFINSTYTKETIRKFLLDPIQSKFVPNMKSTNSTDINEIIYSLYTMCPDELIREFAISEQSLTRFNKLSEEFSPNDAVWYIMPHTPDAKSCVLKYKGSLIYMKYQLDLDKYNFLMELYFIGTNAKSIMEELKAKKEKTHYENTEGYHEKHKNQIPILSFENGPRPRRSVCSVPSTIIIDHVKNDLDTIIKAIKLSEGISVNYNLNKTTGILLYGPHGTGKSTLVRYLAMELDRAILLTGADNLADVVDYVKSRSDSYEKYILLIEDIDFKFVDRRNQTKDDKNSEMMANTDLLFQVLDGVLAENNLVVCATTNYIDRLDPALIRDGRFDFRIEVVGLSYENAVKVCERFDVDPDDIKLKEWKTPISPASLQACILKFKTTV